MASGLTMRRSVAEPAVIDNVSMVHRTALSAEPTTGSALTLQAFAISAMASPFAILRSTKSSSDQKMAIVRLSDESFRHSSCH